MRDTKDVLRWLEEISLRPCDFRREDFDENETEELANNAIEMIRAMDEFRSQRNELLRERAVAPAEIEGGGTTWFFVCGACHGNIDRNDKYCRHCGVKVVW